MTSINAASYTPTALAAEKTGPDNKQVPQGWFFSPASAKGMPQQEQTGDRMNFILEKQSGQK
jgi:hypothetical protein